MNMIKLFALASICFSMTLTNAMNQPLKNINLSYEEESYFGCFKETEHPAFPQLSFVIDISFDDYIPAHIEDLDEVEAYYFNVITTLKLVKHVMNNFDQKVLLKDFLSKRYSRDFYNKLTQDCLSNFYLRSLLISSYYQIFNLELTHIERNKICKMVHQNIDTIIANLLQNTQ